MITLYDDWYDTTSHPENVRVYFAEGAKTIWGLFFRRRRIVMGAFFCDVFDKFMLNFFVAFLFEGTKFKLMTIFSVRG